MDATATQTAGIRVLRTSQEVIDLGEFWRTSETRQAHSYDDTLASFENPDLTPIILLVSGSDGPTSALVGRIRTIEFPWLFGYHKVFKGKVRTLEFPYGSLIGTEPTPEVAAELVDTILAELRTGEADFCRIWYLETDTALYNAARHQPAIWSRDVFDNPITHFTLEIPSSFEEFMKTRSKNSRSNIRRYRNRMENQHGETVSIKQYTELGEVDEAAAAISAIEKTTWQHKTLGQVIVGPRSIEDWRVEAKQGRLCHHVLFIEDKPVAFYVGTIFKHRYEFPYTGYDPTYAHQHPGFYLLCAMVEQFCEQGVVKVLDYGFSVEQYKRQMSSSSVVEDGLTIFAPTWRGGLINAKHALVIGSHIAVKEILARTGVLDRLKKIWRRHKSKD